MKWLSDTMFSEYNYINKEDLNILITDDPKDAINHIKLFYRKVNNV